MNTLDYKKDILAIMKSMVENELNKEATTLQEATYNDQKLQISNLFKSTKEYNRGTIMLRLVVIDSLYSTNAAYSYFSIEEMAERIFELGKEVDAREYFSAIAHGRKDEKGLFTEAYGYRKNLSEGSKQMSLLSKYAYYTLFCDKQDYPIGFPIYDSLAKKTYPTICKMLQLKKVKSIDDSIENYVTALAAVRVALFGEKETLVNGLQQFDMLDAYLWRMGKIGNGNFSLLLGREAYAQFIKNLKLQATQDEDDAAYKKRMKSIYGDKFNFNNKVAELCLNSATHPFAKVENKNYLDQLIAHWRLFVAAGKAK